MALIDDVRVDIGDDGATVTFTDAQIFLVISKAARRLNRTLSLVGTTDEIVTTSSGVITSPAGNASLEDLVLLQTECMLASREFNTSLRGGIGSIVEDGEQKIDTKSAAASRGAFFDSDYSPCAELEKAIVNEKLNRIADDGNLIW